jgi:GH24 family phage-related lysozyme (muramidase)
MELVSALIRLALMTAVGGGLVLAFSDVTPDWAQTPLARPARFDLTSRLARFDIPDPATYLAALRADAGGRAAPPGELVAAVPAEPLDNRTPPPFAGLAVPEAAVELARAAQPLMLDPVQAANGAWVIGYGRQLPEPPARPITPEEADQMLREDLERAAAVVRRSVTIPLNENELGALAEFARSIGVENFERTLVLTLLKAGDRAAAADAFLLWTQTRVDGALVESAALAAQRERTRALFLTSVGGSGA